MTDFDKWLSWFRHTYPLASISDDELQTEYDEYYMCRCESCLFRKEYGITPVRMSDHCSCPLEPLDITYLRDRLRAAG